MSFGRCACGQEAVVQLNRVPKCLACFGEGLRAARDVADRAAALLTRKEARRDDTA